MDDEREVAREQRQWELKNTDYWQAIAKKLAEGPQYLDLVIW